MAKRREVNKDRGNNICVNTHNDFMKLRGIHTLSLTSLKLLYYALAQVLITDCEFFEYELSVKDFVDILNEKKTTVKNYYRKNNGRCEASIMASTLSRLQLYAEGDGEIYVNVFDYVTYISSTRTFAWKLGPTMAHYLLNLNKRGNYIHPLFSDFVVLRTTKAIQLWHLMQSRQYMNSHKPGIADRYIFEIGEKVIREWTGTTDTYARRNNFRECVVMRAINNISKELVLDIGVQTTSTGYVFDVKQKNYITPAQAKNIKIGNKDMV